VNKRILIPLVFLIVSLIGSGFYMVYFYIPMTHITYIESDAVLNNPSRGFYVQYDTGNLYGMESLYDQGISLVLFAYDLKDYVDQPIDQTKLDELSTAFKAAKANGLKVIFRAAYGFYDPKEYNDPSSLDTIKGHISQIAPILETYKNLLLSVQAGFLGPWGEWHHSNLGNAQGDPTGQVINDLVEALCEAVPSSVSVALRRPSFIRQLDPSRIDMSRIAFHDDALLSDDTDMGTYDQSDFSREEELIYINTLNSSVANGGEMTNLSPYTQVETALSEFTKLKMTYLNREYNKVVLENWEQTNYQNQSFLDLIKRKLGYRWSLKQVSLPKQLRENQTLKIKASLFNSGFSAISLPYEVELIVSDTSGILQVIKLEEFDLQSLGPQETKEFSVVVETTDLPQQFTLGFRFKEKAIAQINDERTLIQLANDGLVYRFGINQFARYEWDGKSRFVYFSMSE
jgi:hypothetical protein